MWDRDREYEHRTAKGGMITFPKPYITVLGGITPSAFASHFSMASLEQGFLSRVILVPVNELGREIPFPPTPCPLDMKYIKESLSQVQALPPTEIVLLPETREILKTIYTTWKNPFDSRFTGYAARRFTHLLKLVIILTTIKNTNEATVETAIQANTILTHTELLMPEVIGEMGRGPHAVIINLILNTLKSKPQGMDIAELSNLVHRDVRSLDELNGILNILRTAGRILSDEHGNNTVVHTPLKLSKEFEKFINFDWLAQLLT